MSTKNLVVKRPVLRVVPTQTLKVAFVPVRYKKKIELPNDLIKKLPQKIILFTTIQYHNQLNDWKRSLEAANKRVYTLRSRHAAVEGQLLGCGIEHWDVDADAFLFVGDGLFHPKALVIRNTLPVWRYDPTADQYELLSDKEIELATKRQKGALATFYASKKIGVLVTTKYGQQRLQLALNLRERFPDKEFTFVLFDTLAPGALEDFPFVECFVNTLCPRIGLDDTNTIRKPVLNIGELGFEW